MLTKNPNSECTLYIGNLNPGLEDTRLFEFFRPFGEILTCRIMRDIYSGESRRFAFVSFSKKEFAEKARNELNYQKLDGWEVRICFKRSPSDFKQDGNIFVKNLSLEVNAKELDALCNEFGKILSCTVRNDENGKSLGYGYVQFEEVESAEKAIEKLNGITKWGQTIEVIKFVANKNRNLEQKNVYLKNFPKSMDKVSIQKFIDEELKTMGKVTSEGIFNKEINGVKKFFCFVAFEEEEQAKAVIEKFNNHKFPSTQPEPTPETEVKEGEEKPVVAVVEETPLYVVIAQSKRARKAELSKNFSTVKN